MPIADSVRLGENVKIHHPSQVNLYGCTIGDDTRIGSFVEIQKNASVGMRCKISSHTFVCEGVVIEDEVFVGHGVMFTNDRFPRATNPDGTPHAGAVVTKDVADYAIVAGVPARVVGDVRHRK
jgi:acetyltransferase-like isoleucine patch superfamily enzyme